MRLADADSYMGDHGGSGGNSYAGYAAVLERSADFTAVFGAFAVFFFLGYLLYSTMYAAVGAITTTEQEGQQLQFIVVIPLVLSVFMLGTTLRTPDAPAVVWTSLIPFFAPIVMYTRIVVQTPPLWQIALSLFLLIATVGGLMVLCAEFIVWACSSMGSARRCRRS